MVDTQVWTLPITPSFPCNDSVLCRAPVYVAFSAAKVLLETIQKDAEEFINLLLPADIQFKHPFPYVQYLCQFHANDCQQKGQLGFQITETFDGALHSSSSYHHHLLVLVSLSSLTFG